MFAKLTDTSKGAIFSVLVLCLAVGAALLIRFLNITYGRRHVHHMVHHSYGGGVDHAARCHPRWLHQGGLEVFGPPPSGPERLVDSLRGTLLITVAASAVVWATPLASFVVPEGGILNAILSFFIFFGMVVLFFGLAEEIGMRGYLQPHLMSLGRTRALFLVGLVFATWHMPLIFLAPAQANFPTGNLLLFFPLFYGTVVAASFFFGYLRIYTGSIWPASIAHAVHNAVWSGVGAFTLITASPLLVNVYLVGDFGLLILIGTVIGAIGVGYYLETGWTKHNRTQMRRSQESPRHTPQPRLPLQPGSYGRSQPNLTTNRKGTASRSGTPSLP